MTGEVGANKINQLRLERLSAETQKPIVVLRAYHDKPKTQDGRKMKPEEMNADDFRGMEGESSCSAKSRRRHPSRPRK